MTSRLSKKNKIAQVNQIAIPLENAQKRHMAFPDGSFQSFSGNAKHLCALGTAALIRNALEDQHAGYWVNPEARVHWSGGSCLYGEVARISPRSVAIIANASNDKIAEDLSVQTRMLWGHARKAVVNLAKAIDYTYNWYLPEANPETVSRLTKCVMEGLRAEALRKEARTAVVAKSLLDREGFISDFFAGHAEGNSGPAEAARSGKRVNVETAEGMLDWDYVSHISDSEMMQFNIGLADHIFTVSEGIEGAAFRLPSKRIRALPVANIEQ